MADTKAHMAPSSHSQSPKGDADAYTVKQAEIDFGACGKILYLLQKTEEPADMDINLLFGLEACWKQQKANFRLNQEQVNHVSMMQSVFRVPSDSLAPHVRKARETAHQIDWAEKIKNMRI